MEQEMTVQELIDLVNAQEGDFMFRIDLKEVEADGEEKNTRSDNG